MARKQSISNKQVVGTEGSVKLPSGAIPSINGVEYISQTVDDGQVNNNPGDPSRVQQLETPRDLKIESQTINFTPGGQQYVTVVISFEAQEESIGHEVRISEA